MPAAAHGTNAGPFAAADWGLVALVGTIWGSSFLLIDIALTALPPPVIAAGRLTLGASTLAVFPSARRRLPAADRRRAWLVGVVWVRLA